MWWFCWKEFRKCMIRKFVTSIHQSIQKFVVGYEIFVSRVCSFVNCILVNGGSSLMQQWWQEEATSGSQWRQEEATGGSHIRDLLPGPWISESRISMTSCLAGKCKSSFLSLNFLAPFATQVNAKVHCPCHNQGGVLHVKAIDHHNMLTCWTELQK